jgi:hypothetical protein
MRPPSTGCCAPLPASGCSPRTRRPLRHDAARRVPQDAPCSQRARATFVGRSHTWSTAWAHLLGSVRTGEAAFPTLHGTASWEYRASPPEEGAILDAMTGLSTLAAEAVVGGYDFSGIGVLVDVGGGQGEPLAAILEANPALRGVLFDQPHVVAGAGALLERVGVADRCEVAGGSFLEGLSEKANAYLPIAPNKTAERSASRSGRTQGRGTPGGRRPSARSAPSAAGSGSTTEASAPPPTAIAPASR